MSSTKKNILMWGRYGNYGPDYPRNRVIESVLRQQGHGISRFLPTLSFLADWEYVLRGGVKPDLIWVPCFRQRDVLAAARYARRHGIALVFDPLISSYDKQVNERHKFSANSTKAQKLLAWERRIFQAADWLIADTAGHAEYFAETFSVASDRIVVVPVGAEEALFAPQPWPDKPEDAPLELTFFGTFIGLQGVNVLTQAILHYDGPPVRWRLIGEGPMLESCKATLAHLQTDGAGVSFEPWGPLAELPSRLASSDAILGIFGSSVKAQRVIPNKVYQGLAIGRPVITALTAAYPKDLTADESQGFFWALPGDAESIVEAVKRVFENKQQLCQHSDHALHTYKKYFSNAVINVILDKLVRAINDE